MSAKIRSSASPLNRLFISASSIGGQAKVDPGIGANPGSARACAAGGPERERKRRASVDSCHA